MPSIYASTVINGTEGWGDSIPVFWILEYIWQNKESEEIYLWDGGSRETCKYHLTNKFYHRKFMEKPIYIYDFLDGPPDERRFDAILSTHYNAPFSHNFAVDWASPPFPDPVYGGLLTPALYLDGPPDSRKLLHRNINDQSFDLLVNKQFAPTFPNLINKTQLDKNFGIEEDYICVQFRRDDPWKGDILYGEEYDLWSTKLLENVSKKSKVVILSDFNMKSEIIDKAVYDGMIVDATRCSFWKKLELASKAKKLACSHSGFGLCMAGYGGWKNTILINTNFPSVRMPPVLCFANGLGLIENQSGAASIDIDLIIDFLTSD